MSMRLVLVLAVSLLAPQAIAQDALGRRCATPDPTITETLESMQIVRQFQSRTAALRVADPEPITVPVAFHVLSAGSGADRGDLPTGWLEAQVDTLNGSFASFGIRFALALVQRVENPDWYRGLRLGSAQEREMKEALALDPARVLNVYTADLDSDFLGWATTPDASSESDVIDGVVLLDQSLPGGDAAPYNLGHTGTHEVGHWLGLLHTFAGGCTQPNDGVADTPQERSPAQGCPTARDSCPLDPGTDPVRNYMDYSDDACMTEFTPGQVERSLALVSRFRPTIVAGGFAVVTLPRGSVDRLLNGDAQAVDLRVTNALSTPVEVVGLEVDGAALRPRDPLPEIPIGTSALIPLVEGTGGEEDVGSIVVAGVDPERPDVVVRVRMRSALAPLVRLVGGAQAFPLLQGETTTASFVLANDGRGALSFDIDQAALPRYVVSASPSSGTVPPGGSVEITLSLSTGGLDPGDYPGAVEIETNDARSFTVRVPVALTVVRRPATLVVGPSYPNPASGMVTIPLELPDDAGDVDAVVFDARGREVAVVGDGLFLPVGYPELRWDASAAPAGLYIVRVTTSTEQQATRVIVAR